MPQITTKVLSFAVLGALALALSGCGDANPKATFDPAAGKHPANWLPAGHSAAAEEDVNGCAECHGDDLTGGISKVTCFGTAGCHLGGTTAIHPLGWGQVAYLRHPAYIAANGTGSCATTLCHGTDLRGVTDSGFDCLSCHQGGTAQAPTIHPWGSIADTDLDKHAAWLKANLSNGNYDFSTCKNAVCHGTDLRGAWLSGPSCYNCHNNGPPTSPLN